MLFGLAITPELRAQTFTNLYSFSAFGGASGNNSDGAYPLAGLILSGNTLYGTTYGGGTNGYGTVFAVNTNGTGFTNLHNFTGSNDGAEPYAELILSGNTLYGTTYQGGTNGYGTVFAVNTDGTCFTNLHSFTTTVYPGYGGNRINSDGANPIAGLILSGNTLYGTAHYGGTNGYGAVFAVNTDGTGFTTLYNFTAMSYSGSIDKYTNSDGAYPWAGLTLSGNTLYGTAYQGGTHGYGTVFALTTNGTGFTNLYNFTGGSDGAYPQAKLILSGNTLYGTANWGGTNWDGTVFAVNTDGASFTNLHSFTGTSGEGSQPTAELILLGNTLYGTTAGGGNSGNGTVFALTINGTDFTNLHRFTGISSEGSEPEAGLILSANTLFGTTAGGGNSGNGTVFSLTLPAVPKLTIIPAGTNVILAWPTNTTAFTLQSTTNLVSSTHWSSVFPTPVVMNGQNIVTNSISGEQIFYRLSR